MILAKFKYILFTLLIFGTALCISFFIIWNNWYYISIFTVNFLFALSYKKVAAQTKLFVTSLITIISFLAIFTMDNFIFYFFKKNPDFEVASFLFGIIGSVSLLIIPFGIFFNDLEQKVIDQERKNRIAIHYPNLLCTKHLTRTFIQSHFIYNAAICRSQNSCSNESIIIAKQLIGLIGLEKEVPLADNNYYIPLLNQKLDKITDADYDVIEIHENPAIKDYNGIINKIVSFFYNELNRYKPLNEIIIRIIGNPQISESTKRLMKERFLKIEYLSS